MRYEDANDELNMMFLNLLEERFPVYCAFKFKLLFDNKKRTSKGKIILASIELPNAKLKHISRDSVATEGYDVLVIVDSKAWDNADIDDRKRILSHELRHLFVNENGKLTLIDHDVSDFMQEIELNKDKPTWCSDLSTIVNAVYEQEKMLKE